jgi:hypothetical protein
MLVFVLFFTFASSRLISINRDSKNITNVSPFVFIDPNFTSAKTNNLLTQTEVVSLTLDFFAWMLSEWNINVTAGVYDPATTGYFTSVGIAFPTFVANEGYIVDYDSEHLGRWITKNWFVTTSTWFFQFTTSYTITSGPNAGAVIDTSSVLTYGYTFYLRKGANWIYPINKEAQFCYSAVTGKFFPNMFIGGGTFGGRDSLSRFICIDKSTNPAGQPSFMSVLNMYTRNPDGTVDEYKRSTLTTL